MTTGLRNTGIDVVGDMPWGTHFCHFYETKEDLLDSLVPYFKPGLENDEFCVWVIADPLTEEEARSALRQAVPDLDRHLANRNIEIFNGREWYTKEGAFDLERATKACNEQLAQALARGYSGMRFSGDAIWLQKKDWRAFCEYEKQLNEPIADQSMIVFCTYPLSASGAADLLDVARNHQFALARRGGEWEVIGTPKLMQAREEIKRLNKDLEQRVTDRTKQLSAVNEELRKEVIERERAEGLLQKANARAETILDSITDRFFAFDKQCRFTYFNRHANDLLKSIGKDPASLIGKVYWDEFLVRYAEEAVRRAMTDRVVVVHEFYFPPLKQWIEGRIYPSPDGGLAIYQRDITERKRAEEGLRRSEAYLAEGQRISHTGSWAVTIPSSEVYWSQEMFRIYGLDPATTKLSQEMAFQLIHPEDRAFVHEAFDRAVREKSDFAIEHRAIVPDGTIKYLHALGHPVLSDSDDLIEYVGTVADVTERKQAEASLRKSNERLEMVLSSITDKFFAFDSEWRYTYFNRHAEEQLKYLGKDPASLIGKVLWEEFPDPPAEKAFRRAMRERIVTTHEHYYPPLGEWVENRIYPTPDGGLAIFVRYITERKLAEEELRKTQAELVHVSRVTTLGELTASIAHELNQPLGAIVTNGHACLRLLSRSKPDLEGAREAVESMIADGLRAGEVIKRIRALLKKTGPGKSTHNINETIQEVITFAAGELKKNQISLRTELSDDLPLVTADRVQLQQVVLNLILNSSEAMSRSGWQPRKLLIRSEQTRSNEIMVTVQDTGIGLDPKNQERVFDPFFTTKEGGLGLGLTISRTIVESHGGKLWSTPNEGQGATFQFTLPTSPET